MARAVVFSPSGASFAVGYADGTVILHPTENLVPAITVTSIVGRVMSLHVVGDAAYAATDEGIVERIDLCDECLTNRALAEVARQRLARATALGVR